MRTHAYATAYRVKEGVIKPSVNPTPEAGTIVPNRLPAYGALNLAFIVYAAVASAIGPNRNPRFFYLALLFAICSSPLLFMRKVNDRFASFAAFCAIYFVSFGVLDLVGLTSGSGYAGSSTASLSPAELLIILGGVCFTVGYLAAARRGSTSAFAVDDWPMHTLIVAGLLIWAAGTYATWYWQVRLTVRSGQFVNDNGQAITSLITLGRYVQPLGILILAYAYVTSRSTILAAVMAVVASYQVYLGYISDTKGGAMMGGILVIVTGLLVRGKILKTWALAAALFIFLAFPVFQAHRTVVVGDRGTSNAAAANDIGHDLELSIAGQKRAQAEHAQSFFERSSVKASVEMIVDKAGDGGVPYQHGYTLIPLATSLIPRLIWPSKPSVETGQLVNTEFHVTGERTTYISPSHLGELYWNFGWIGALGGMLLLGSLLGWINRLCDLSTNTSVTRLLILGITILQLEIRFEASIATEYSMWFRSVLGILILHRLFADRGTRQLVQSRSMATPPPAPAQLHNFPNLLR